MNKALIFAAGVIVGLAVALAWGNRPVEPTAAAQQLPPLKAAAAPRFAISAFGTNQTYGAYMVDTLSGEVYLTIGSAKPTSVGRVGK